MKNKVIVSIIPQLKDNYSYIVHSLINKSAIIIDPAESKPIIDFLIKNNLYLKGILVTHHHSDHTSGLESLLNFKKTSVYSPNKDIFGTNKIIKDNDIIDFDFLSLKIISTPGHTSDHVVFYNKQNSLLFSGDTLFHFGCGRVFEETYDVMQISLKKIEQLPDSTKVYCGHEYSIKNLSFLMNNFNDYHLLSDMKKRLLKQIMDNGCSMPFLLGEEKQINPFLSQYSEYFRDYMNKNGINNKQFFKNMRDLRNNF